MPRDLKIEQIFTTADDAMQGLWGIHNYIDAAVKTSHDQQILVKLPNGSFQITHEWNRLYEPKKLVEEMKDVFEFVHCRESLTALVAIFEATITRFIEQLASQTKTPSNNYKKRLEWVFDILKDSDCGSSTMINRLPITCGDVDNARRLRNCCAHNNGKYDKQYEDAIDNGWVKIQMEQDFQTYRDKFFPIFLVNHHFEHFCRSHIELLHILHNTLQKKFFNHTEGYTYQDEGKQIEWYRILSGRKAARL